MKTLVRLSFLVLALYPWTSAHTQVIKLIPTLVNNTNHQVFTTQGSGQPPPGVDVYYLSDETGDGQFDALYGTIPKEKRNSASITTFRFACPSGSRIQVRTQIKRDIQYITIEEEGINSSAGLLIKLE